MDELMDQFAIEARELLQQASDDLLALERTPNDRAHLESAFRAIHTLKGSVGLFDLAPMHDVLHRAEDLLTGARSGTIEIDAGLVDPLFAVVEWAERCVEDILRDGSLSEELAFQSRQLMLGLHGDEITVAGRDHLVPPESMPDWAAALLAEVESDPDHQPTVAVRYEPHPECFFNGDDPLATLAKVPSILHLKISPRTPWPLRKDYDPFRCNLVIEALTSAAISEVETIFRLIPDQVRIISGHLDKVPEASSAEAPSLQPVSQKTTTMRVDTARIDDLLQIAGELVTAKNGLLPLAEIALEDGSGERLSRRILANHRDLERLVGSLYAAVTKARMVPIGQTFRRFPRLVRETAARLGKAVDIVIEGDDVEADREIVEELFEPLLHLVRNALDHGIEPEAERVRLGKSNRGTLTLRAQARGETIEVELRDDGRGVIPDSIKAAAIAKGLISRDQAELLSDTAAQQLLFTPGFTTTRTVSEVSGRGVGLDAVQSSVQGLGGHIELTSTPLVSTVFTLFLPISFSMSHIVVVSVGHERFGIPIESVIETVRLKPHSVMPVRASRAFVLRGQTTPLLHLADLLKLPRGDTEGDDLRVVIVYAKGERIGIAVDAIGERAETLLRPLSGLLHGTPGISGTTVLGDGRILFVLDLEELVE